MRRAVLVIAAAAIAGCVVDDPRTCLPGGEGEDADSLAATLRVDEFAAAVRTEEAAAFLYTPGEAPVAGEQAIYVLCVGEAAIEAGPIYEPILSDARAGVASRVGASLTGSDGGLEAEPGYLVGRVDDDVVELQVEWSGDRSWSFGVEPGFFLVPLPDGVPVEGPLNFRFLGADGALVWAQPGG